MSYSPNQNLELKYRLGLNEMYVWFLLPTYPNFFNPTLNIKMVFGEKIPKMGTFSDFVTIFFVYITWSISLDVNSNIRLVYKLGGCLGHITRLSRTQDIAS